MTIAEMLELPPPIPWDEAYRFLKLKDRERLVELLRLQGKEPTPVSVYKPRQFSHGEMLQISGLKNTSLQTWFARGLLDRLGLPNEPGRGNRRRYSYPEAAGLAATKVLVDTNLPIVAAVEHARWFAVQVMSVTEEVRDLEPQKALAALDGRQRPYIVAVYPDPKAPKISLSGWAGGGYAALPLAPADCVVDLHKWFCAEDLPSLRIFDLDLLAFQVIAQAWKVLNDRH